MTEQNQEQADTLLRFPCAFPIKVFGPHHEEFAEKVTAVVAQHVNNDTSMDVTTNASSQGRYLAVTITIEAQSKQQLDSIYLALNACEFVTMTL